ncbi:caspase family protein [Neolewinella persica]|uniref:caspase family protein n=1 Tax=Neolewinella persica TaxID=70998 RepID=UPI00035DEC2D|nr:caspase family protein [Neolewinella persica]
MRQTLFLFTFLCTCILAAQMPQLVVPGGHTRAIMKLTVSPGGGLLASSSIDETVKIWETASGRELHTFRPGDMARGLAFSPDGKYLAVAAFNEIHLLEMADFRVVSTFSGWNTNAVAFHPGRNELYYLTQRRSSTGEDPQQVFSVSVPGGQPRLLGTVPMGTNRGVAQLVVCPDGAELLIVIPGSENYVMPTGGGSPQPAAYAHQYTPEGDRFFIRNEGNNATFGVRGAAGERWSVAAPKSEVKHQDLVNVSGFYDGKLYWSNTDGRLANGSYLEGGVSMFKLDEGSDRVIAVGADGYLYLAGKSPYVIRRLALPDLRPQGKLGEALLTPQVLAGSETTGKLTWGLSKLKTLTLDRHYLLTHSHDGSFASGRLHYSTDGSLLASSPGDGEVFSYQATGRHPQVKRFKSGFADTRGVAASADGLRLAVVGKEGYLMMDTKTDKSVGKGGLRPGDAYFQEHTALSPDGKQLLLAPARFTGTGQQTKTWARLVNVANGEPVWEKEIALDDPVFSADGRRILAQTYQAFVTIDAASGRELERRALPNGRFPYEIDFSADREWAAYTHDNRAYLYYLPDGREYPLTVPGETGLRFDRMAFFGDGFVAAAGREGVVRIFDVRNRQYVAALLQYADTDDWAIVAPDGRFDASPGAMGKMYYRVGQQRIALEQLFEGFYTPGLVGEILGRRPGSLESPRININNLLPPPEVEINYQSGGTRNLIVEDDVPEVRRVLARTQDAVLSLKARAPGGSVAELRLYHNGKLLGGATRNLVVEDDVPVGNERTYTVRLLPGENEFRAVALNNQRTESSPARLLIEYTGVSAGTAPLTSLAPASAPISNTGAASVTLHLVTVGIDKYANAEYNLNYATADASGVEDVMRRGMSPLVGNADVLKLRDGGASRADILAALQKIVAAADADDLFIFYYAGHGIMSGGENDEFYFVPHDVKATSELATNGISARELQVLSAAIPAHRQLYLLDACQSAGAISAMPGAGEEKAIAQLARTTGTHWITATGSEQLAGEFDELGHGAFTYALLGALQGKAAGTDGTVTVEDLKRYLFRTVPELTERYNGVPQYPASFGYGRNFAVSVWR